MVMMVRVQGQHEMLTRAKSLESPVAATADDMVVVFYLTPRGMRLSATQVLSRDGQLSWTIVFV